MEQILRKKYRPEIDGLRGFAVLAVILNHLNKNILPGGYLGVDIFFVISGYVITSSLSRHSTDNFKEFISGFYERRIKRLVPVLVVFVSITSIAICFFNASPGVSLKTGLASLFGLSNIFLLNQSTDYFAASTQLNVFTHTWSLGVEEQFYILFPFFIWFSGFGRKTKNGVRNFFLLILALTIISFVGFVYFYLTNQSAAYFLMPTRFWEMSAGCLIFIVIQKGKFFEHFLARVPSFLFLALIIGTMYLPNSLAVFSTLLVVILSSILLITLKENTLLFNIFTNSKIIYVGHISYSLYLWHWSVLAISRWTIGIHWWSIPIQILLMFVLASISYRFIETPFRKGKWFRKSWKTFLAITFVLLSTSGGLIFLGKSRLIGSLSRFLGIIVIDNKTIALNQNVPGTRINRKNCHDDSIGDYTNFKTIIDSCNYNFGPPSSKENLSIFLGGDSHSYMLRPALANISRDLGAKFYSISGHRFPPVRNRFRNGKIVADPKLMDDYMLFISRKAQKGDVVVISNRLSWMFSKGFSLNKDELSDFNYIYKNRFGKELSNDEALQIWSSELYKYAKSLTERGVKVVYILPFPEFTKSAPHCLANVFMPKGCEQVSENYLRNRYLDIYNTMNSIESGLPGFYLVDPFDILCSQGKCNMIAKDGKSIMYIDSNHISNYGSNLLIPQIRKVID